ncbi:MAG: hypothetical protein QX197_07720 [Methylococcaceae bacterium]
MDSIHSITPLIAVKKPNKVNARADDESAHKQPQQHASPKGSEQSTEQAVQHIDELV